MREMQIIRTRGGVRLTQHGVVVCELRTLAGPTHSVFDVLAALMVELAPPGKVGLLGFSAGGIMAPLAALGWQRRLSAVDLDSEAYELFCRHCPLWTSRVRFQRSDALAWLRQQRLPFGMLVEDLSVAAAGDVIKPAVSWLHLPALIRRRLHSGGVGLFNLLPSPDRSWPELLPSVRSHFGETREIRFEEFENRLLVTGQRLPSARVLASRLGKTLRRLRSNQAGRIRVGTA